ncbi:MAG: hypothetical protein ACXABY_14265, partial [Candidatus Thorarchaeota archaeon]
SVFHIKAESTDQVNDWGSRNEWKLDYLRVRCIDRKSENEGVNVQFAHDVDNLYPFKGEGTDDFYKFECTARNEEGHDEIDRIRLYAKTESGTHIWGVNWENNVWSSIFGVNLITSECYTYSTGYQTITVVFAVQFDYNCADESDIDLELYHESDTWSETTLFDTTTSGLDLDQKPALAYGTHPSLPEKCDPGESPIVSGSVVFADSAGGIVPNSQNAFVEAFRTHPNPQGEWYDGIYIDAQGNFQIPCQTKGGADTLNVFRISVYDSSTLNLELDIEEYVRTTCDAVTAYDYGLTESTVPIGTTTTLYTKLWYTSNREVITNGTVVWNGVSLVYNQSNLRWEVVLKAQLVPTAITFNSLTVNTLENITTMTAQPSLNAEWIKLGTTVHLASVLSYVPVSTVYDPQSFIINVWLTDQNNAQFSGWINLSIGGSNHTVFYDGANSVSFSYSPPLAGGYTLLASYAGDVHHEPTSQILGGLTATLRDISRESTLPTSMDVLIDTPYSFYHCYDYDFQGVIENVTYIRNFPINLSMSIWWTLSPDYGEPLNYVGGWDIISGEGLASWSLPWDLDGNGLLTDVDFACYLIIHLDGQGVYEDTIIHLPISVKHNLEVFLSVPSLTYSDSSMIDVGLQSPYDPTYSQHLSLLTYIYASDDNETWIMIGSIQTDELGSGSMEWICDLCGPLYFKCETVSSMYTPSVDYSFNIALRENTELSMVQVTSFTFSDQGTILVNLTTDEGEPMVNYPVYLEIQDGTWISIGTGLTNESGYVTILWIPTLPAGNYMIRVRAPLTESEFYNGATDVGGILLVGRETLEIVVDETSILDGFLSAFVTDDEGVPVEGVQVTFFEAGNPQPLGTAYTDSEGRSHLEAELQGSHVVRAIVYQNEYYREVSGEVYVAVPQDMLSLMLLAGTVFFGIIGIAVMRKVYRNRTKSIPGPLTPEAREALEEEHKLIPERRREETERKLAELDGEDGEDC